jgi:hypothetical protein
MTEDSREERNPVLEAVDRSTNGPLPYVRVDRPGLATSVGTNDPYLNLTLVPFIVFGSLFVFDLLKETPCVAIAVVVFFWVCAALILVMNIWRIPGWHRARKVAAEHVKNGGTFPPELRWYT